jgi:hypothetical protein
MMWKPPDLDELGEIYPGFTADRERLKAALLDRGFDPEKWWRQKSRELERTYEYSHWNRKDISRCLMQICIEALDHKAPTNPSG